MTKQINYFKICDKKRTEVNDLSGGQGLKLLCWDQVCVKGTINLKADGNVDMPKKDVALK